VIDTRVNPAQIYGRISAFEQPRRAGQPGTRDTSLAGSPRPVISAYWADAMLVFAPDGHAFWVDGYAREKMFEVAYNPSHIQFRGASDLAHAAATGGFHITLARDPDERDPIYHQIDPATGQPAWNRFGTIEDAFASITPFARVFVARDTGEVLLKPPAHPDSRITAQDLDSKNPYPNR
jgi:hypothetical protein